MTIHKAGRLAAATAGLFMLAGTIGPAVAASAASAAAYLESYLGNYRGVGQVRGQDNEDINCRMSMTSGNGNDVNYHGRCLMAGANLSIAGTITYNAARSQFEAAMTSNTAFSGTAVGRRVGDDVVFSLKQRAIERGSEYAIAVGITLHGGGVDVDFQVVDQASGKMTKAIVPFRKV